MNMKEDASSLRGVAKISGEVGDTGASKKTKVSIWLLKPDAPLDKLFGEEILSSTDIEGIGTVYTSEIPLGPPAWVETFFENKISGLTKGGAGAILKTSVEVDGEAQHFLVSFGLGFHKINQSLCEGRFGLKVVLNAGDLKNGVRSLDKRNLTAAPRLSREQASKQENLASFGIDFEQDILHSLTLASNDEDLGVSISGGTSLCMSTSCTIRDIRSLLPRLYKHYKSGKYKKEGYEWVDHVNDAPKKYIADLDAKLVAQVNAYTDDNMTCYLSPPEIEDYSDVVGFACSSKKAHLVKDDIVLDDYRSDGGERIDFDAVEDIKKRVVYMWSAGVDSATKRWSLYRCINMQISHDGHVFILANGKWYMVDQTYSSSVDTWFGQLAITKADFDTYKKVPCVNKKGEPALKHSEEDYNKAVAAKKGYACLDRDLIDLGPRKDIEACDLYAPKRFIHVKIYTGSSAPISHLLAQATVSTELFFGDKQFREEVNAKLPKDMQLEQTDIDGPVRNDYLVTLGIIANKDTLNLPFFSKVNLRSMLQRMELMNVKTELLHIRGDF